MADMTIEQLNHYIEEKEPSINNTYRPLYHMSPRVGWMNDPNGLVYHEGKYHLYYQANPLRTRPGQMTWGHFVSPDLIRFQDLGIALALDKPGEHAYSGGAINVGEDIHIFYTLHTEMHPESIRYDGETLEGDEIYTEAENEYRKSLPRALEGEDIKKEQVYHAFSRDGSRYDKGEMVFDNASLPSHLSRADFRDPSPVKIGENYYLFLGAKDIYLNQGVIVVLKGKTLNHFDFAFQIGPFYELGDMAECPCYRKVDGKDVLLVCGSNTIRRDNDFRNINSSVAIVGDINFEGGMMRVDFIKELDKGDSFYAPQFIAGEARPILVGWLEMWGKRYPTSRLRHGYVGAFSIPRLLRIKDGDLYQEPVDELLRYESPWDNETLPRQADIRLTIEEGTILTIKGDNGRLVLGNSKRGIFLDNTEANSMYQCARWSNKRYEKAHLRILLDVSCIEVFIEEGKEVISSRFYIDGELRLSLNGQASDINILRIGE